jgi:hypothetical protein
MLTGSNLAQGSNFFIVLHVFDCRCRAVAETLRMKQSNTRIPHFVLVD